MRLCDVPPFQRTTPWREWWLRNGHKPVPESELRAWVANAEKEVEQRKALLDQRREEGRRERRKIR